MNSDSLCRPTSSQPHKHGSPRKGKSSVKGVCCLAARTYSARGSSEVAIRGGTVYRREICHLHRAPTNTKPNQPLEHSILRRFPFFFYFLNLLFVCIIIIRISCICVYSVCTCMNPLHYLFSGIVNNSMSNESDGAFNIFSSCFLC